ncbi:MAG: hypothetical protein V3T31_05215 [candidate division Zixibacteria bacterium]
MKNLSDTTPDSPQSAESKEGRRRLIHTRKSARRLVDVQKDIIRRLSDHYKIDRPTRALLAEMQICSNRLLEQIEECCAAEILGRDEVRR